MKIGIVYDEKYAKYDLGPGHPFRGDRFINAIRFFEEQGVFSLPNVVSLSPIPVTKQDLLKVHDKYYVDLIFHLGENSRPYDVETPVSPEILEAVLLIIGGAIESGKAIFEGKVNRSVAIGCGYHHAGRSYGGGFCLFNDVAMLTEFLREKYRLKRIMILDYDVHSGNGTSDIYYTDPSVLFISMHQDPRTLYPGTGFIDQIGKDAGEGFNVNVPLPPGTGDKSYLYALKEIFIPLAEEFKPEIILANGGSDPHFADILGSLGITVKGFFEISKTVAETAEKICNGKVVIMPGSGYNPIVLPPCWYALAAGVLGLGSINISDPYTPPVEPNGIRLKVENMLAELKQILRPYWKCFK